MVQLHFTTHSQRVWLTILFARLVIENVWTSPLESTGNDFAKQCRACTRGSLRKMMYSFFDEENEQMDSHHSVPGTFNFFWPGKVLVFSSSIIFRLAVHMKYVNVFLRGGTLRELSKSVAMLWGKFLMYWPLTSTFMFYKLDHNLRMFSIMSESETTPQLKYSMKNPEP